MGKVVLYLGGFRLPDCDASALRAMGNAAVLREVGYEVVIAGKFAEIPDPDSQPIEVHGFAAYDVRQPLPGLACLDYTIFLKNVRALVTHIGPRRIAALMAYNYPGLGLNRLIGLAREFGLPVINETTEWYGWEGFRPVTNVRRTLESRWRNNGLVARSGNLICATNWSKARHPDVNSLVLPFALDPAWDCWQVAPDNTWCGESDAVRLVYSGSPGLGMHKDRLPLIVEALDRVAPDGRGFEFAIVGMTAKEYLLNVPSHSGLLGRHPGSIHFLGRLAHREAVAVLKAADFSIFVRARNRVSEVGFPTKYAEATTCGIPVLTNRSSDIVDYLTDGKNGFLLEDCNPETIEAALNRVLKLSRDTREQMKARVALENPFAIQAWVPRMRNFMNELRMPR